MTLHVHLSITRYPNGQDRQTKYYDAFIA